MAWLATVVGAMWFRAILVLVALYCLILPIGMLDSGQEQRALTAAAESHRTELLLIDLARLQASMVDENAGIRGYALSADLAFAGDYDLARRRAALAWAAVAADAPGSGMEPSLPRLKVAMDTWQGWAASRKQAIDESASPASGPAELRDGEDRFGRFQSAAGAIEAAAGTLASRRRAESDRLLHEALPARTLLPLAGSGALLLVGSLLLWRALRPVTRLALAARRLATGGEPVIPYVRRQDEAGAVARALLGYREAVASQRAITQHSPVGMLTLGLNLEVRDPSPALTDLFGYDYEDWKTNAARYVGMVTHPDDIEATGKLYQRLLTGGSDHLKLEKRYVRRDGSIFWGSYTVTMVRDVEGKPAFYVGMIEDINERREKLARAARAQRDLLPGASLDVPGYDLAGLCRPTEEVGGDLYDWYQSDPRSLVLTLGDVMGKGMPAAILMATMRIALRSSDWLPTVRDVVESVAEATERDLTKAESFVTLFHARLDLETGLLTYVDAGHGLLMVVGANGAARPPHTSYPPLGVLPGRRYQEFSLTLLPGEALVVFSDGVLDVHPDVLKTAGALLQGAPTAREMAERLATNPDSTVHDDVTVVVLRRRT